MTKEHSDKASLMHQSLHLHSYIKQRSKRSLSLTLENSASFQVDDPLPFPCPYYKKNVESYIPAD